MISGSPATLARRQKLLLRAVTLIILAGAGCATAMVAQTADRASLAASADLARQQGDVPKAIELYEQLVQVDPQGPDGWWFLGILQYDANQYVPAREALSHFIELTPHAGPALALRGLCEFENGQYAESLQDLQRGISQGAANEPRNARIILYHQAILLTRMGAFDQSLENFRLLAAQHQDNHDLLIGAGLAGLRMNLLPQEVQPDRAEMLSSVGQAALLFMNGEPDAAAGVFQAIFARYPDTPNTHYLYGYLLFATKPDPAIEQFEQELKIAPQNAAAHAMCAWAFDQKGEYAAAIANGAKAVAEQPSLSMGQLAYGKALAESGDVAGALPHLETVLQTEPNNLEAHFALVKTYAKLGRSEDARRERLLCLAISDQGTTPVANP